MASLNGILAAIGVLLQIGLSNCYSDTPYMLSPASRQITPKCIYRTTGNVTVSGSNGRTLPNSSFILTGPSASITFDFGQIVAGIPTLTFGNLSCPFCNTFGLPNFSCGSLCNGLGIAYTEASEFVGTASDNSTFYSHADGTVYVPVQAGQTYTVPSEYGRGSFRYLTLSLPPQASMSRSATFQLKSVTFTAQPSVNPPSTYAGYFQCSDDLLNRIWYAGAYTLQLSTVPANSSVEHAYILSAAGWSQSAQAQSPSATDEFLSDGGKRDRNPWSGDLAISLKTSSVLNKDQQSVRNALSAMLILQNVLSGYFPYAGSPLGNEFQLIFTAYSSDTYHLWSVLSFCQYVLTNQDATFGNKHWPQIVTGIRAVQPFIDSTTGLFGGTKDSDWGRIGQGGYNIALNALYSHTLVTAAQTAAYLNQSTSTSSDWLTAAEKVKISVNSQLFDASAGLFFDNTTSAGHALYPQDGNVLAVLFNLTTSPTQVQHILENLAKRHTRFGALAPEAPTAISPFISGLELFARFYATPWDASSALSLLRTQWGYMLHAFSNSTFIEGYASDGSLHYPFYPGGAAFISHAHGWSTGPMYVLSAYVAGLRASKLDVVSADGDWVFQPTVHGSGVSSARAGYERVEGTYSSSWNLTTTGFEAAFTVPERLKGTVYLPLLAGSEKGVYVLDGKEVGMSTAKDGFIRVPGVDGGRHAIKITF